MDLANKEAIEGYFDLLEDTLKEHNLMNSPGKLYNMDESGMPLDHRCPNVVARRGEKKVQYCIWYKGTDYHTQLCQCTRTNCSSHGNFRGKIPESYHGRS